ncbi:MAG: hypothetical protein OXB98_01345 [Bryobacterales bacterium]|nr:hypothetical protein [Bryobacterales bacterium]
MRATSFSMLRIVSSAILASSVLWGQTLPVAESIHYVRPGDNPQAVLAAASPGGKLVFLPGMHEHPLRRHRSLLYVDKPIDIELMEGAVLRLADHQSKLEYEPELTIDHGAVKKLDDFSFGGRYDGGIGPVIYTIRIDCEGAGGQPDTFSWITGWGPGATQGAPTAGVPITGDWQPLSNGVQIKFESRRGHNEGSFWALSYDGPESYGIRIGHGLQEDYIEDVRIFGRGAIDLNQDNNVQPSELVKDISACVLIHGRVRNVSVEQITMTNTMRSVMVYGEHTGKFLRGGDTEGGESFDAENIAIAGTRTINPKGRGYLLGHPSHRGRLSKVRCNYNYMETLATSLEPNFNLSQYEVIGNVIKSGGRAIHCWRKSVNGIIKNNVRIDDTTGKEVVMVNSPGAWGDPENLTIRDNRNHLSDALGRWASVTAGLDNRALGALSVVGGGRSNTAQAELATIVGGEGNRADGRAATVTGGEGNEANAPYSRVHGAGAMSLRPAEDVLAGGAFGSPGDAQASRLVAKGLTTDNVPRVLLLAAGAPIRLPENTSLSYRILVVARDDNGRQQSAFEALGLARSDATGDIELFGNRTSVIHKSDAAIDFDVVANSQGRALELQATGLADTGMRWVAQVDLVEVRF